MNRIFCFCLGILILAGCGSSKKVSSDSDDTMSEAQRYEADFKPSEFDPDPDVVLGKSSPAKSDSIATHQDATDPNELVSGFRVQIFSTTSIDEANSTRDSFEAQFTTQRFYMVYDPPTYKIRGGDFLTRYEADKFARQLREHGYKDAWVVPEKVHKAPSD